MTEKCSIYHYLKALLKALVPKVPRPNLEGTRSEHRRHRIGVAAFNAAAAFPRLHRACALRGEDAEHMLCGQKGAPSLADHGGAARELVADTRGLYAALLQ